MTIGQVAQKAGVAASAIRYYESRGLLPEPERLDGQRARSDVLGRLAFIGVAQSAGFKLEEIRQKGWLEVAKECDCQNSGGMRAFPAERQS